ncbi:MAG: VCBS repeat-containing protein [Desulfobacterales bacterium]
MKYKIMRLIIVNLLLTITLSFNFSANAAEPKRIVLLPFKINAEKDMTFLQNGIFDMLTTRLSKEGEVEVISRQAAENAFTAAGSPDPLTESAARTIGAGLNADYTLFGSVTILGNSTSLDAKMVDVTGQTPTASFFDQSQDLGGIITKVNQIATQINATVFGRQAEVTQKVAPPAEATAAPAPKEDLQAHPEKLLRWGRGDPESGSPFITSGDYGMGASQFWKSRSLQQAVHGLALGDVNRDGKLETVIISDHGVLIYAMMSGKFFKVAEINEGVSHNLIAVDVADINANGTPEIFVSSLLTSRQALNSYVLEFDGQNFVKIVEKEPWYFRVVESSARGKVLLGQRHRKTNVFSGHLQELVWQGSGYIPQHSVAAPKGINALGVAMLDYIKGNEEHLVALNSSDHLQIIDGAGQVVWTGGERRGGSDLYYRPQRKAPGAADSRRYYPMRIAIHQPPNGEDPEILVARNFELAGMKLEQFRKFTGGQVEALFWDGMGLRDKWRTRKLSAFVRDFAVGDFDNDGTQELVIVAIERTGEIVLTTPKSTIVAYDLVLPEKAE